MRWVQLVALGGIVKKWLGHQIQAIFGAFRLLLGGGTVVQLPLAKYEIYLTFSKSVKYNLTYSVTVRFLRLTSIIIAE